MPNPLNHRTHPQQQRDALAASIRDVGFIRSVTVNKTTGNLIDGHERLREAIETNQEFIDVEYVELSEREEKMALATMDSIGEMAATDPEKLDELLRDCSTGEEALQELLAEMADSAGIDFGDTGEIVEDEAPIDRAAELQKKWGTARGQLWLIGVYYECPCGERHEMQAMQPGVSVDASQQQVLQRRVPTDSQTGSESTLQANGKGEGDGGAVEDKPSQKGDGSKILHVSEGQDSGGAENASTARNESNLQEAKTAERNSGIQAAAGTSDSNGEKVPMLRDDTETDDRSYRSNVEGGRARTGEHSTALPLVQRSQEKQEHPVCKCGIELGPQHQKHRHRMLCGDSTKGEDVERVMGGEEAELVMTDPPYGIGAASMTMGHKESSKPKDARLSAGQSWDDSRPQITHLLAMVTKVCIWGGQYFCKQLPVTDDWLCWHKKIAGVSFGEFELAWTNFGKRCRLFAHHWSGEEKQHITQKPLAVISWAIEECPANPTLIVDPFLGSGTTLVACEQLGRRGFGIELSPAYVAVCLERLTDQGCECKLQT